MATETSLEKQLYLNSVTRKYNHCFISADIRGLFGISFNDFGKEFVVFDSNGEEPKSGILSAVSNEKEGVVACLDETRHGLEDGDFVTFTEVEGMEELNGIEAIKIKVLGPYTFSIGDTTGFKEYKKGGIFTQVKQAKSVSFKTLQESLNDPDFIITDFAKMERPQQIQIGFLALDKFNTTHKRLPHPRNEKDALEVWGIAQNIAAGTKEKPTLDEKLIKELAFGAQGELSPMAAVLGGMVAQEVLKACSGKFGPVQQYFAFDSLESLPESVTLNEAACAPRNSRYDSQIAVFGAEFQEKISNQNQFLVGAGAIGCEMLKNWALMGLGVGPKGAIHLTDMDTIEKSNLNRQFLFRPADVSKLKSECAANAVQKMNPDCVGKIKVYQDRVGPETEEIFGDAFFESLSGVTNALDNVEARKYVDRRCVYYRKPLLESGTLGTKGNTQVNLFRIRHPGCYSSCHGIIFIFF